MATIVSWCGGALQLKIRDIVSRVDCLESPPRKCIIARRSMVGFDEGMSRIALTMTAMDIRGLRQRRQLIASYNFQLGSYSRLCNPNSLSEIIPRNSSQATSHVEGITNKNVKSDETILTNGRVPESGKNNGCSRVSDTSVKESVVQVEPDFEDRRQSDERSSDTENDNQAERGNVGVGEIQLGDNAFIGGNGDNDQDIPVARKRGRRPKRKKKKAYAAGIAMYDSHTNSVRLKESATETPAAAEDIDIKQGRQRSPCSTKRKPIEQEIKAVKAKPVWTPASIKEVSRSVCEFYSDNRSRGMSLGVEDAARLSRLTGLEDFETNQPAIESNKAAPSQDFGANVPEVALKSRPTKKFAAVKEASKTKGFEENTEFAKKHSQEAVDSPSLVNSGAGQQPPSASPNGMMQSTSGASKGKVVESTLEAIPKAVAEQVGQVVQETSQQIDSKPLEQALNVVPEPVEQVDVLIDQVKAQVNEQDWTNASVATDSVTSTAGQVAESITLTATQVTKSVTTIAAKLSNSLGEILKDGVDMEDEFEEASGSDCPDFRGLRGLNNYKVIGEEQGILVNIRDFYFFMMKKPLPEFAIGMIAAPIALSMIFTLLYLPEFQGLVYDETARDFLKPAHGIDGGGIGLKLSWMTFFQVFMFSLSLSTGLQPDVAPLSPYTLVVANLNALLAQLMLAFLSAAVFARLSQPSQPVRCSSVALIHNNRGDQKRVPVLSTRCVLAGPQPCELINVKVDLTYRFNTVSTEGSFFRGSYSLKLVRSHIALLDQGMLVRHIISESSPLCSQTPESLHQQDAIFVLSMAGMERSSMQPIFHVQFYSVRDGQVIWNAEFEDMILINQKNQRIVDHSKLSSWRSL